MPQEYAIELKGITKTFGSVVANNNIELNVKQGEILALLGENGSGKTTLMNMLSGIYKPDKGQILVNGKPVSIDSPEDSKRLGIGMVHQHFKLVDVFSAADNIWMGKEKPGLLLKRTATRKLRRSPTNSDLRSIPRKRSAIWRSLRSRLWRSSRSSTMVPGSSFWTNPPLCLPCRRSKNCSMFCAA